MKRRFDFRLQRLLRVRAVEEGLARSEWARMEAQARGSEEELERLRELRKRTHAELSEILATDLDPRFFVATEAPLESLGHSLRSRRERALTDRAQAERSAEDWRRREAARRALEELEERARLAHRAALTKEENAELDETSILRSRLGAGRRYSESRDTSISRQRESKNAAPNADETNGGPAPLSAR